MTTTVNDQERRQRCGGTFVDVGHALDGIAVPRIADQVDGGFDAGDGAILVLNFHDTRTVDHDGVAFLTSLRDRGNRRNFRVVLTEVPRDVRQQLADGRVLPSGSGADGQAILLCCGVR